MSCCQDSSLSLVTDFRLNAAEHGVQIPDCLYHDGFAMGLGNMLVMTLVCPVTNEQFSARPAELTTAPTPSVSGLASNVPK